MSQDRSSNLITWNCEDYILALESACNWFGIKQGRSKQYIKLVREFYLEGKRSRDHLPSLNEGAEVVDLYKLWELHESRFSGIKRKISRCLSKGPLLQEDENPDSSSNHPRNEAFVYLLAGELIKAGVHVAAVDGITRKDLTCHNDADITIECNGSLLDVQCKRPQAERKFSGRFKEARDQILDAPRPGQEGIIAIDCTSIKPPEKVLVVDSPNVVPQQIDRFLIGVAKRNIGLGETKVTIHPQISGIRADRRILGLILFARIPVMTKVGESPILTPFNNPFYSLFRPDSSTTFVCIPNLYSPNSSLLRIVYENLAGSVQTSNRQL